MKYLWIALIALGSSGCNTMIGMGRDTKEGYEWCKRKIEESRQGGGGGTAEPSGNAPIY
jgi:predicted small secreted protein